MTVVKFYKLINIILAVFISLLLYRLVFVFSI